MDSDSEPEEVSKETSKQVAIDLIESEKQARESIKKRKREKRRLQIERNTEQKSIKKLSSDIERLPDKIFEEFDNENFLTAEKQSEDCKEDDQIELPKKKSHKNHVKIFETPSTTFKVATFDELNKTDANTKKSKCFGFRDQMMFNKNRVKRSKTWRIMANYVKRAA